VRPSSVVPPEAIRRLEEHGEDWPSPKRLRPDKNGVLRIPLPWHLSPVVPPEAGRRMEKGVGCGLCTPTLILPRRGGGDSLAVDKDAPCGSTGFFTSLKYSLALSLYCCIPLCA